MAIFDDISKKAQDLLGDDKVKDSLKSEQAEGISDKILDGAADVANKVTGNKFADQVKGARDEADKHVGNQ